MNINRSHIPLFLTLCRLVGAPLILPFLLVALLPQNSPSVNMVLAFCFVLFGSTDFFDGFIARRYGWVTSFGGILDPIADKFLCYVTLISLMEVGKIFFYWVIILIGRELFIMALRLVAVESGTKIAVSPLAKIKTAVLLCALTWVIANPYHHVYAPWINGIEQLFILSAVGLSVVTAVQYYYRFMRQWTLS